MENTEISKLEKLATELLDLASSMSDITGSHCNDGDFKVGKCVARNCERGIAALASVRVDPVSGSHEIDENGRPFFASLAKCPVALGDFAGAKFMGGRWVVVVSESVMQTESSTQRGLL